MGWEILLAAALEAGFSLLAEAGFGDQVRDLRDRLTKRDEKKRAAAFARAYDAALSAVDDAAIRPLLEHRPFREAVITGLLDPVRGFDLQALSEQWAEDLPALALPLRGFFNALENALLRDEVWGPLLERYRTLRFQRDALDALRARQLDLPAQRLVARLSAELYGPVTVAAGPRSVAIGGRADGAQIVTGDVQQAVQIVIQQLVMASGTLPAGAGPRALRRRYLQEVARETNRLPWTAMEAEQADPYGGEALALTDVYTALDTTELERVEKEEELRDALARLERGEARRVPAQQWIDAERRLLILGDPGSGKSTLVKHTAYLLAQAGLAADPAPWLSRIAPWTHGPLLPVVVELRRCAVKGAGRAGLLLDGLQQLLGDWKCADCWPALDEALRGAPEALVFFLDGLDEVPTEQRGAVVAAVQDLADRYPQHRYVVTCRPYAYIGQPWTLRGFRQVTLAPFDDEQVDHFVQAWYKQLAQRGRFGGREADERAARLQAAARRPDLRGLAARPLLLTVMAMLHTFRGQLPEDRTELYASAVDLFLRRWEGRAGGETGVLETLAVPGLRMSDLEAGLYEVAYRAHAAGRPGGTADVPEAELRAWLAPYLGGDWNKAGEFIAYIRERAGLLVRHKTAAYTFPHRTFQEFLAACYLVGRPDYPGEAAALARNEPDRWREVFSLAAGHAARTHRLSQAVAAVNALCPREVDRAAPDAAAFRCAVLAGEALREAGLVGVQRDECGQAALERVRGWLLAALRADTVLEPRARAEAGDLLADLGDPRFREDLYFLPDEALLGFVAVPAGPFTMGSDKERDPHASDRELPQHEVTLPLFYMARYPVTVGQYRAFVAASGHRPAAEESLRGIANHPVAWVSWDDAVAYCEWLTGVLGEEARKRQGEDGVESGAAAFWGGLAAGELEARLPSEAEWEKGARGVDGRRYPWGEEADRNRANYGETGIGEPSAVGCFRGGASPYGVEELAGNVWEWTASEYKEYPYVADGSREAGGRDAPRVLRGGAFFNDPGFVRCACRFRCIPNLHWYRNGFRVVVAAPFSRRSGL